MLLESFYSDLYLPLCLRSRSANTRRLYLTTIANFQRHLSRRPALDDFTDATVNRFLMWFRDLPRSPFSVNKERANLLAMWRFAARKGYVEVWPDVLPETQPERIPQAWTDAEIFQLWRGCALQKGDIGGIPSADWWRALLCVIWSTGERISAITAADWQHADLASGYLLVPAESRKGGRADRLYRLGPDAVDALLSIRRPSGPVFPWPYSRTYLWRKYGDLLRDAGLPDDARSKFHRIRRTVATLVQANGGDATQVLGHSDSRITRRHYLDPRMLPSKQAVDYLPPMRPAG